MLSTLALKFSMLICTVLSALNPLPHILSSSFATASASAMKMGSNVTSSDMLGAAESETRRKAVTVDLRRVPGVDVLGTSL